MRLFFDVSSERVSRPMEDRLHPATGRSRRRPDARIEELDFSVRTYNCLKKANIQTIADLVRTSEDDLMNIRNFGRKSLVEVQEKLVAVRVDAGRGSSSLVAGAAAGDQNGHDEG